MSNVTTAEARHASLVTVKQAQDRLKVSRQGLYLWERSGQLVPVRLGRSVRYRESDLDRVVAEGLPAEK